MTLRTFIAYLFGSRDAILHITHSRRVLLLGLLFVLSAGFAREYDGEDLLREPWHLLIPLGASLGSSFALYCLVDRVARLQGNRNPFWQGYIVFLALFWMTAPLAWLYAIPVERFLPAADSVRANLWLLGIVATWRVALITRAISVLYRCHWVAAFFVVILFSDAVLWIVLELTPMPILSIMGGIRLTESENVLLGTQFMLRVLGTLSAPIWLFGTVTVAVRRPPDPLAWQRIDIEDDARSSVRPGLWALSAVALVIWVFVLPKTQPEQVRRRIVEKALAEDRLTEALSYMSALERDDFPPHWDSPPRIGYGEATPDLWKIMALIDENDVAPWVHSLYKEKVLAQAGTPAYVGDRLIDLAEMDQQSLEMYTRLLGETPEGREMAARHSFEIENILEDADRPDSHTPISDWRRELLSEIAAIAEVEAPKESPALAPAVVPDEPLLPELQSDAP